MLCGQGGAERIGKHCLSLQPPAFFTEYGMNRTDTIPKAAGAGEKRGVLPVLPAERVSLIPCGVPGFARGLSFCRSPIAATTLERFFSHCMGSLVLPFAKRKWKEMGGAYILQKIRRSKVYFAPAWHPQ